MLDFQEVGEGVWDVAREVVATEVQVGEGGESSYGRRYSSIQLVDVEAELVEGREGPNLGRDGAS